MERPHYLGHRKRLRERFLRNGLAGFAEHEVIELLLTVVDHPIVSPVEVFSFRKAGLL